MYDLDLKNKVILITGGSDGLGYASAELLSSEGAYVVVCGIRDSQDLLEIQWTCALICHHELSCDLMTTLATIIPTYLPN